MWLGALKRKTGTLRREEGGVRDVVVLVGMGRSGTSAFARVLSFCGGAIPLQLLPPNFANPTGYWEPQRAVELNDAFLRTRASSWYDAGLALQLQPAGGPERERFITQIAAFLEAGFEPDGPIILKDPRISGLLPYWRAALTAIGLRTAFVHVFRNPTDVAASLTARDGLAVEHSMALWLKYNLIAERDARRTRRVFVAYEDLMQDWEAVMVRCISELDVDLTVDDDTRASVNGFLSPALHHQRWSTIEAGSLDPATADSVSRTYSVLKDASHGVNGSSVLDRVLNELVLSNRARHSDEQVDATA